MATPSDLSLETALAGSAGASHPAERNVSGMRAVDGEHTVVEANAVTLAAEPRADGLGSADVTPAVATSLYAAHLPSGIASMNARARVKSIELI
jgi:hypothetical protein